MRRKQRIVLAKKRNRRTRSARVAMLLVSIVVVLAACGYREPVFQPPTQGAEDPAPQQGNGWPRTYDDRRGNPVVIKNKPQRVAVLYFGYVEYLLALDVTPVATTDKKHIESFETLRPYGKQLAGMQDLGDTMAPNMEKLVELEPDLIVVSDGLHDKVTSQLGKIAPVVVKTAYTNWEAELRDHAFLLGQEERAETFIAQTKQVIKKTRDTLQASVPADATFAFVRAAKGGFNATGTRYFGYYYDPEHGFGLRPPAHSPEDRDRITMEGMTQLRPNYIFIQDKQETVQQTVADLANDAVWQSLPAVQHNRVYGLDASVNTGGPLAIRLAAERIVEAVTASSNEPNPSS